MIGHNARVFNKISYTKLLTIWMIDRKYNGAYDIEASFLFEIITSRKTILVEFYLLHKYNLSYEHRFKSYYMQ